MSRYVTVNLIAIFHPLQHEQRQKKNYRRSLSLCVMHKYEKLERIDEFNNVNPDVRLRDSFPTPSVRGLSIHIFRACSV
jgi:hypothetical protein